VGKFLSVDPITAQYPELTPYQFASNRPIDGIDLDGKEFWSANQITEQNKAKMNLVNDLTTYRTNNQQSFVATGVSKIPANVKIHNYYTQPSTTKTIVNSFTYGVDEFLYKLINDSKIVGSSVINGPQHASDLVGNKAGQKERIMAFTNVTGTALGFGEFSASTAAFAEGDAIIANAARDGVKTIFVESADDIAYMKFMNAEALYSGGVGKDGAITIFEDAHRSVLLEEAIHHQQRVVNGDQYFYTHRTELEIEAQETLLRIGEKEKWSGTIIQEIKDAKAAWSKQLSESSKH
jgi:hypothetical protein